MKPDPSLGSLIVIPCLDEERHLPGLLTLLIDDAPPNSLIVVVDGGSTDGTVMCAESFAARHANVRLLHNPARIQSAAVNTAVRALGAGRKWLVRIDAHLTYPRGYVAGLIEKGEALDVAAVVVPMVTEADTREWFQKVLAALQNTVLGTGGAAHRGARTGRFIEHGHHALCGIAAFSAIGGYDEQFSHNEDAELDIRLRRAGGRIWLEPQFTIIYHPRRALRPLMRQYFKYGEGRAQTGQRHKTRLKARQLAPLSVLPAVLCVAASIALAPFMGALSLWGAVPFAAWACFSVLYGFLLAIKQRDLRILASGPIAMAMHLAWSCGYWRQILVGFRPGPEPSRPLQSIDRPHAEQA
ncbi:glycosyltransferase family 2 protein [Caulobacter sp. S45]|uniref:glycosyltransferase family 2 protein n=1 Tax=Caulobacter sp. S45 TaxID=1641861 RepID=UPI00157707AD|nr:glycosyltransferase family 2 protein [Caulobacter sp. S45]